MFRDDFKSRSFWCWRGFSQLDQSIRSWSDFIWAAGASLTSTVEEVRRAGRVLIRSCSEGVLITQSSLRYEKSLTSLTDCGRRRGRLTSTCVFVTRLSGVEVEGSTPSCVPGGKLIRLMGVGVVSSRVCGDRTDVCGWTSPAVSWDMVTIQRHKADIYQQSEHQTWFEFQPRLCW